MGGVYDGLRAREGVSVGDVEGGRVLKVFEWRYVQVLTISGWWNRGFDFFEVVKVSKVRNESISHDGRLRPFLDNLRVINSVPYGPANDERRGEDVVPVGTIETFSRHLF